MGGFTSIQTAVFMLPVETGEKKLNSTDCEKAIKRREKPACCFTSPLNSFCSKHLHFSPISVLATEMNNVLF